MLVSLLVLLVLVLVLVLVLLVVLVVVLVGVVLLLLVLICTEFCADEQLWVTTSLRGVVVGELTASGLREGVHSGDASGSE